MLVKDKNNLTLEILERTNFIETEAETGIIKLHARPCIPNILKLKICNNAPIEDQEYDTILESDGRSRQQKLGVVITSITLSSDERFKFSDEHGITKPHNERNAKVKGKNPLDQREFPCFRVLSSTRANSSRSRVILKKIRIEFYFRRSTIIQWEKLSVRAQMGKSRPWNISNAVFHPLQD